MFIVELGNGLPWSFVFDRGMVVVVDPRASSAIVVVVVVTLRILPEVAISIVVAVAAVLVSSPTDD